MGCEVGGPGQTCQQLSLLICQGVLMPAWHKGRRESSSSVALTMLSVNCRMKREGWGWEEKKVRKYSSASLPDGTKDPRAEEGLLRGRGDVITRCQAVMALETQEPSRMVVLAPGLTPP